MDGETSKSYFREVLERLSDRSLKSALSKCLSAQFTITLLGHVVSPDSALVGDCKTAAIKNFTTFTTPTELRSCFVLAGYYYRLFEELAKSSSVLHAATSSVLRAVDAEVM